MSPRDANDMKELQRAADMAGLEIEFLELRQDAERWRWIRSCGSWPETEMWASDAKPEDFDRIADDGMRETPNVELSGHQRPAQE